MSCILVCSVFLCELLCLFWRGWYHWKKHAVSDLIVFSYLYADFSRAHLKRANVEKTLTQMHARRVAVRILFGVQSESPPEVGSRNGHAQRNTKTVECAHCAERFTFADWQEQHQRAIVQCITAISCLFLYSALSPKTAHLMEWCGTHCSQKHCRSVQLRRKMLGSKSD